MPKIYIGNLNYSTDIESLENVFSDFGEIQTINIVTDRVTGLSRGYGFIEFVTDEQAEKAIVNMNQKRLDGRELKVVHAISPKPNARRIYE